MRRLLRWLLATPEPSTPARLMERFGDAFLDPAVGEGILRATPERERYRIAIRDLLSELSREEKRELVDRVLVRFALYVFDLPASQASHHARPFGHLDHALKVAHAVVEGLAACNLRLSHDPVLDEKERPCWAYAGFLAALLHDAGKVLDLEVATQDGKDRWNPQVEPLAHFCGRNGLEKTTPEHCRFHAGRGLKDHEWRTPMFYSIILPTTSLAYVGSRLSFVSDALLEPTLGELPPHIPRAAGHVASLIRTHDADDSRAHATSETKRATRAEEHTRTRTAPLVPAAQEVEAATLSIPEYFANAFRIAIEEKQIPINTRGGVYVGREHFFLVVPTALAVIVGVMYLRWAAEDSRIKSLAAHDSPTSLIIGELAREGYLLEGKGGASWKHEAEIATPGGEREFCEVIVLNRSKVKPTLPLFPGDIALRDGAADRGTPAEDGHAGPQEEQARSDALPGADKDGEPQAAALPQPPAIRPVQPSHRLSRKELLVERELEPERLLSSLKRFITVGSISRNLEIGEFFVRPDFTWFLHPALCKLLAQRIGLRYGYELGKRMLDSLAKNPEVVPAVGNRLILRIRTAPDDPNPKSAFRVKTDRLFTQDRLLELGLWPHEIEIVGPTSSVPRQAERGMAS